MKIGLVIPIYNRPQYVKQCFYSLLKLTVKPDVYFIIDDASTDKKVYDLVDDFRSAVNKESGVDIVYTKSFDTNQGVRGSLKWGIDVAFGNNFKCDIVINLDSDAIVKPDFIENILDVFNFHQGQYIASGFNNPKEPTTNKDFEQYCFKAHANGINMCFNRSQYEKYIKPSLLKEGNWDYNTSLACQADKLPFVVNTPSVVQHIGVQSSMGHVGGDFATDFKQLSIPNVTLFGIDSHDKAGIERAASISQRDIDFGAVKVITDDLFTIGGNNEQRRKDYSKFMLKELTKHFTTSHILTIHADGYVVNFKAWSDEFLQYDYIGATWLYKDGMNVGNGGFSLRSKKLCDILATNDIDVNLMHPEDHCICRTYRPSLEKDFGIKFAPEEVANRFSIEAYGSSAIHGANMYSGQFGFHSRHVEFGGSDIPTEYRLPALKRR